MLLLFSRMNAPLLVQFCLWLMVCSCQAFQYPRCLRSLDTTKFSGNITRLHDADEAFNGTFNQTAPSNALSNSRHGPVDGNIMNDLTISSAVSEISREFLSSLSGMARQFPKQCSKSWSNLVYGFCYQYRNLLSTTLWKRTMLLIIFIPLVELSRWLEQLNPIMHAYVTRVCGKFMFSTSLPVVGFFILAGTPVGLLLYPRFRWQQNQLYSRAVVSPICEEIVCRLMLHHLWQQIQRDARHFHTHLGGKLQGRAKKYWSSFMGLLEHKYSFRVLSSLVFGIMHIGNYYDLWESNEINDQKDFVLKGMFHALSTFLSSFLCLTPLFETRGVMAAIGAHSAWNLLCIWEDGIILGLLTLFALIWGSRIMHDTVGDDRSTVLHKLTPPDPSRVD